MKGGEARAGRRRERWRREREGRKEGKDIYLIYIYEGGEREEGEGGGITAVLTRRRERNISFTKKENSQDSREGPADRRRRKRPWVGVPLVNLLDKGE